MDVSPPPDPLFDPIEPILLSTVEEMFWNVDRRFDGSLRGGMVVQLDGCIEADLLTRALRCLQRRHPKLRASVELRPDGRLQYVFDPSAPAILFRIDDYEGVDPPWKGGVRRLLQSTFPDAGPLAAVAVLRNRTNNRSDLLLTVHHAVADGLSAIAIVTDLLAAYADAEAHRETSAGVQPAVSGVRARSGGWRNRFWLMRRFIDLQRREKRTRQTPLPSGVNVSPQSQWAHFVLSREDTVTLARRCRKERASLTAALSSLVCCALMDTLQVPEGAFKSQMSFDIRAALSGAAGPVTNQDLGCLASIVNFLHQVPAQPVFWDLARSCGSEIAAFLEHEGPVMYHNLTTSLAGRLMIQAASMVPASSDRPTFFITHYGVLNMREDYGTLRPRACAMTFKNDLIGPSLVVEALVLSQQLNVGIAAAGLDPGFWERLQRAVRDRLTGAAASDGERREAQNA